MIDEGHGAAIRYDLQRIGLDLADVWRGALCPRRVIDLVEHAPDDSALTTRLRGGPQHRAWDVQTHLLGSLLEAVHHTAWVTAQVNSKKRIARPKPLPRPGEVNRPRRFDFSRHPDARPIPAKYRSQGALTGSG